MIIKQSIKLILENMMNKFACFWTAFACLSAVRGFDLEFCRYPLGTETGKILDSAFSSSSSANEDTMASKARIRSETSGWCPFKPISSNTYEYLQIDFENITVITLIELQGKYSVKPNDQFADAFRLEYRRTKEQKWIEYKDFSGQSILSGNSNSYIPTIRDIHPAIIAKQIRIVPIVIESRWKYICMRVEIYGCSYEDGLMSYSIPQGDKRGYNTQFFDEIYDGKNDKGVLRSGLGQLTDGIFGQSDYRLTDHEQSGYDWIGWKNRSSVSLFFHFDTLRNFTSIHLHTSNFFPHHIYLFHSIIIDICADVNHHQMMEYLIPQDGTNSSARIVEILLENNNSLFADCLNLTLIANNQSEWILISEIQFQSIPIPIKNNTTIFILRYWRWFLYLICLGIVFLMLIVTYQIQSYHYRTMSLKLTRSPMDCCHSNHSALSSISNSDLHHHLMLSTTDSTNHSDDFSSTINSYLSAISNPTMNSDSSMEMLMHSRQNPLQGPCGNSVYECLHSWNGLPMKFLIRWRDEQLIMGENYSTIGGEYGAIFHGYLHFQHPSNTLKSILIKTLTTNDRMQKDLFDQEHALLNHLHHPNLVQFYGYTINETSALIEHSDLGDIYTCLSTSPTLSINRRLSMITQLSNALCYLHSHQIIHRDVAARNCLIFTNYQIKLTHSALASEQFQSHYYTIHQTRIPIRWMSPESIAHNEFTFQSDIWSFGITLWEIINHCRMLPYHSVNDDEVYRRLSAADGLHLSKPDGLDKEVIDLMLECWRPYDQRPTFNEIAMFFNKRLDVV